MNRHNNSLSRSATVTPLLLLAFLIGMSGPCAPRTAAQETDAPDRVQTFPVGEAPEGLVFDGANIWVANLDDNTVTKLRASDGASLGTFSAGESPLKLAFDGANIWVTNSYPAP